MLLAVGSRLGVSVCAIEGRCGQVVADRDLLREVLALVPGARHRGLHHVLGREAGGAEGAVPARRRPCGPVPVESARPSELVFQIYMEVFLRFS